MADRHLQERIELILSKLSIPVAVIDREYDLHALRDVKEIETLEESATIEANGTKYFAVPKTHFLLSCKMDQPGAQDVFTLACELVEAMSNTTDAHTENSYDVYRRALRGELAGSELEALSHEHQLPADLKRCVLVFHIVQTCIRKSGPNKKRQCIVGEYFSHGSRIHAVQRLNVPYRIGLEVYLDQRHSCCLLAY